MTERFVYFLKPVGMDGPIKIGSSLRPISRLDDLVVWSPMPLELVLTIPGTFDLEYNIQDCFAGDHVHHEWFKATPRLTGAIAAMLQGLPVHRAIDLSARQGDLRAAHYAERSRRRRARKAGLLPPIIGKYDRTPISPTERVA